MTSGFTIMYAANGTISKRNTRRFLELTTEQDSILEETLDLESRRDKLSKSKKRLSRDGQRCR